MKGSKSEIIIFLNQEQSSRILSGEDVSDVAELLKNEKSVYIVCDKMVADMAHSIANRLPQSSHVLDIQISEEQKDISTVLHVCEWLMENGADRKSFLLAVGGGITTDIAGFAACIFKRGIRFGYVPTTLLSLVDAGIGGKNGVNFGCYKNMLGIVRQPGFVFESFQVLDALPYREFRCGSAEILKTAVVENVDGIFYEEAVALFKRIHDSSDRPGTIRKNRRELMSIVHKTVKVKAGIVERDCFDSGERRLLNLGHTFAHAIESYHEMLHGEAVAVGMVMAARLSEKLGIADRGLADKLEKDVYSIGLPYRSNYRVEKLAEAMAVDKKAEGDKVNFVLPKDIGDVVIMPLAIDEVVRLMEPW